MEIKFDGEYGINFLMLVSCLVAFLFLVQFVRGCELERSRIEAEAEVEIAQALKRSN